MERSISLKEVAQHSTADDFWTVIDGVVYDMSGYVPAHPGGAIILLAAGTDCTVMFHQYHMVESESRGVYRAAQSLRSRRLGVFIDSLRRWARSSLR